MFVIERNMDNAATRGVAHPAGVGEHITREKDRVGTWEVLRLAPAWPRHAGPYREGEEP